MTAGDFVRGDRFGRNTYSAELDDLSRLLVALDDGRLGVPAPPAVGLLGHSRGGGITILQAASAPRIGALVTWAGIASVDRWSAAAKAAWRKRGFVNITNSRTGQTFPLLTDLLDDIAQNGGGSLDVLAAAGRMTIPWLILHGEADETVGIEDARALYAASGRATTALSVISGAGHTFGAVHPFRSVTPELDRALAETVGFFGQHLAG